MMQQAAVPGREKNRFGTQAKDGSHSFSEGVYYKSYRRHEGLR